MQTMKLTLIAAIAALATACASQQDPSDTYAQGWRGAQILAIGNEQLSIPIKAQDCRSALPVSTGYTRFAVASYSYGGSPNLKSKRIVAIPNEANVSVGDRVFVNVRNCKLALRTSGLRNERP